MLRIVMRGFTGPGGGVTSVRVVGSAAGEGEGAVGPASGEVGAQLARVRAAAREESKRMGKRYLKYRSLGISK
jgi:hypothetical protein